MRVSIDKKILDMVGSFLDQPIIDYINATPKQIMRILSMIQADIKEIKEEKKEVKNAK